jgi:hypothetical protein
MHSKHQTIKEPAETTSRPVTQQQRVPINNPRLDHNRQTYRERAPEGMSMVSLKL